MHIEPFQVAVPQADLDDLQVRLERTRWAPEIANDDWRYGTRGEYLRALVAHWRSGFDWRAQERAINAVPQFHTSLDGIPIHFLHVRGKGPRPIPLLLGHGWPWTFWDLHKVIGPLSDPAAHGGDPADAFDLVVPSLPGYTFSTPLTVAGINFWRTADLWVRLMEGLGYPRFAAQGGDWGALVAAQLGHKYADRLIGVHLHFCTPLTALAGRPLDATEYGDETHLLEHNTRFVRDERGYTSMQATRPQTLAHALEDSPVGLCAWLVEKRRSWSDCGGDVERVFTKDELLTTVSLYWLTRSFGSSARFYYETAHHPWKPSHDRQPVVEAPTGVARFPRDVLVMPRRWIERYYNVQQLTDMPRGGHFAPMEQPALLVDDIRRLFRGLRG
ncbi:MAG TPA: epoxide hydrolase [Kofleriaceae bacterium]|jgi:pimeloyl-ACP methyl ester carboxylesterase|nr:epoxide hydrolase [Kofleriaceae bacterium]